MSGPTTSATYYSDVRVPADNVVGEVNEGWPLITNQLNHERVALTSAAPILARCARCASGRRTPSSPTAVV